jgi:hypothetical protein
VQRPPLRHLLLAGKLTQRRSHFSFTESAGSQYADGGALDSQTTDSQFIRTLSPCHSDKNEEDEHIPEPGVGSQDPEEDEWNEDGFQRGSGLGEPGMFNDHQQHPECSLSSTPADIYLH